MKKTDKNIILTSTGFTNKKARDYLLESLDKYSLEKSALIITTAAQDKENHKYSKLAYTQFRKMGFSKINFFDFDEEKIREKPEPSVIYVCGGDTFHLLKSARRQNFGKFLADFFKSGVYVGVSAGSLILGSSIKLSGEKPADWKERNLDGFGIVPFMIKPHTEKLRRKTDQGSPDILHLPDDYVVLSFPGGGLKDIEILKP